MTDTVKINQFEIENIKRVKAVKVEPSASGLTIIGGKNNQGKTSVTDAIAWALGGEKYRPSNPQREGSVIPPSLNVTLSNGLIVERKGKNSDLKVLDPSGKKGGQGLLNEFVEQLALDLPRFMESKPKEKADTLLHIIGVGEELYELEKQEQERYNRRHAIGQIADQKEKFAREMEFYPDAPKDLISAGDLIRQQQEILAKNSENQKKRDNLSRLESQAKDLQAKIDELLKKQKEVLADLEVARKSAKDLQDESTEELEQNINKIEEINIKVRANLDKEKAAEDAKEHREQYNRLTAEIEDIRNQKMALLDGADLPLPGLSVVDSELTYNGFKWDNMSGSDQLKVAVAIVRRVNSKCGFVLMDKLEQMDMDTLQEFGKWLESEGLQAIATRVSTGEECSIVIEDGYALGADKKEEAEAETPKWKEGSF